ncbi:MAG TPA: cytochrome c [Ignavibacteriaceae bacterium]|nr:cytochrome c [Ignavibacteriaceae bacterium]
MTKPQIWVAAFLALFVLLFLLQRMTNEPRTDEKSPMSSPVTQQDMSSGKDITPAELIDRLGCKNCHGNDLAGTNRAPSLTNLKQYWSKDQLTNYLRNPSSFMSSDRFQEYQKKYPDMAMPSFNNIDVKELGKVAEYLLNQ